MTPFDPATSTEVITLADGSQVLITTYESGYREQATRPYEGATWGVPREVTS